MTTQILVGHVMDVARTLETESVHCIITSSPYYGLRAYQTQPQIWGGRADCQHQWKPTGRTRKGRASKMGENSQLKMRSVMAAQTAGANSPLGEKCEKCEKCFAWRGEHGQEPSFSLWLEHEVLIFRELRRVLRKDGTLWLNIGDAYASTPNGRSAADGKADGNDNRTFRDKPTSTIGGIFKLKDRLLMPHRLAIALHEDGWWVRDEIVWNKLNPMPSSIKDRTCPAHEFMFMLTRKRDYYYDHVAIQEGLSDSTMRDRVDGDRFRPERGYPDDHASAGNGRLVDNGMKIKRSVWSLALEPFPDAHFATFPTKLVMPAIEAGTSARGCCPKCQTPWERVTSKTFSPQPDAPRSSKRRAGQTAPEDRWSGGDGSERGTVEYVTLGWYPSCKCAKAPKLPPYPKPPKKKASGRRQELYEQECDEVTARRRELIADAILLRTIPCTVLDPFGGSGTTGLVADMLGRDCTLIELNPDYARMARRRIRENLGRVTSEMPEDRPADLPLFKVAAE